MTKWMLLNLGRNLNLNLTRNLNLDLSLRCWSVMMKAMKMKMINQMSGWSPRLFPLNHQRVLSSRKRVSPQQGSLKPKSKGNLSCWVQPILHWSWITSWKRRLQRGSRQERGGRSIFEWVKISIEEKKKLQKLQKKKKTITKTSTLKSSPRITKSGKGNQIILRGECPISKDKDIALKCLAWKKQEKCMRSWLSCDNFSISPRKMEKTPWTSKPAWIKVCLRNISSLHFPSFPFLSFPLAKNYKINIDSWKIDAKNDIMKNWNQEWMPHSTTFLLALVPVVMELVKLYEATELTDAMYDMGSNYTSQKKKLDKLREFLMSRSKMVPTMTMKGKKTKAEMQNKWGFKFKFNSTKKKKK